MRMVKSLLLGGAAGLVAVAGAQAADLPMKAKAPAVQYVKICSLYGAGFYYIPGTDTCLKIGGYIRTQVEWNAGGGGIATGSGGAMTNQGRYTRFDTNDTNYRVRAVVTFDTRTQGEYGTLRSYYRVGWATETPATSAAGTTSNAYWDRAFIQFAGFTVGKAQSFFDIYHHGGARNYLNTRTSGDNGASGLMLWAYTAQFGNGFSATLSLEDPRGHNLFGVRDRNNIAPAGTTLGLLNFGVNANGLASNCTAVTSPASTATNATCFGFQVPDIVANLRVDQAWGYFGVSAALHQVAGDYYTIGGVKSVNNGHPEDKWGWAVGVGGQLNVPGMPGDTIGAMFRYSVGAVGYSLGAATNSWLIVDGNAAARAFGADAIFAAPGSLPGASGNLELTSAWSVNAHYEHAWTRALKTSVYGGYAAVEYSGAQKQLICGACARGLNPDYSFWQVGSRTQWSPWAGQLNIGVDVVYTVLDGAIYNTPGVATAVGGAQSAKLVSSSEGNLGVMFRVQRNWYP